MINRLIQVIRVFFTRPWVWLMGAACLFQLFPAWMVTRGGSSQSIVTLLPEVAPREPAIRKQDEFVDLAASGRLSEVKSVDLKDRVGIIPSVPFRVIRDPSGGRTVELVDPAGAPIQPFDELGVLSHLRDVTDLRADLHMFTTEMFGRLGKLRKLEALSLRNAGSVDSASLKQVETDLTNTLSQLTALKRLDLSNAFGMKARVPPLPNLEFLAIGPTLHLEESLKTVAEHSPRLSMLVLIGYPQESLTPGERNALRKMTELRTIYLEGFSNLHEVRAQLREDLPGVSFPRSVYHPSRIYGALYLTLGAMFPCMILWIQSLICFGLGMARTLPGFRAAHLGVLLPGVVGIMALVLGVALWLGISPLPAIVLAMAGAGLPTSPQPVVDVTRGGTWILRAIVAWRIGILATLLLLVFRGQPTLDAFLLGEFPGAVLFLLAVETASWIWGISRLVRQACVLAEIGQPLIPGMVQLDSFSMQPVALLGQKAGRSDPGVHWMDRSLERVLAGPRRSLASLLRVGNAGVIWHVRAIVIAFLFVSMMLIFRPHLSGSLSEQIERALPFAALQGGIVFIMWVYLRWIGRRPLLASELLRPVSRGDYYRGLWKATSTDLGQVLIFLFVTVAGLLALRRMGPAVWISLISGTAGLFLLLHGFLLWLLTARRLWVPLVAGFFMVTAVLPGCGVLIALTASSPGPVGPEGSIAILIGIPLAAIAIGTGLQIWQRRRWTTLELG